MEITSQECEIVAPWKLSAGELRLPLLKFPVSLMRIILNLLYRPMTLPLPASLLSLLDLSIRQDDSCWTQE